MRSPGAARGVAAFALGLSLIFSGARRPAHAAGGEDAQAVEEATRQYDAGIEALKSSSYSEAIRAFKAAFAKKPHPLALYNEGIAWTGARPDAAFDCFAAALKLEGLPEDVHVDAASRLALGRAKLARIEVKTTRTGTVAMDEGCVVPAPAELYVAPGKHVLVAQLGDETVRREVEVKSVASAPRVIDLDAPTSSDGASRPWLTRLRIIGFVAQGSSLVLGVAAIGIGVSGMSARDEFEAGGRVDVDLHDRAISMRTAANVMWGFAAAALITGVVLMFPLDDQTPSSSRPSAFLRAAPGAGFAGVSLPIP